MYRLEINNKIGPVSANDINQGIYGILYVMEGMLLSMEELDTVLVQEVIRGATRVTYTYYMNYFSTAEQEKTADKCCDLCVSFH